MGLHLSHFEEFAFALIAAFIVAVLDWVRRRIRFASKKAGLSAAFRRFRLALLGRKASRVSRRKASSQR